MLIISFLLALLMVISVTSVKLFTKQAVMKPFLNANALKVISGLQNFDPILVQNVAMAAYNGGASHVDIACDPSLVSLVKSKIGIPVCVSSVEPHKFVAAVKAGADMIEIGNFDSFYSQGISFSAEDVIQMTRETRALLPNVPLSVTIPHQLCLEDQVELARAVEQLGADIIQTEGKCKSSPVGLGVQEMIELASPTLAAAFAISRAVSIPVMCASGLTDVTAPLALAAGARGVGIGSIVNQLKSPQQMLMAVSAVAFAMGRHPSAESTSDEIIQSNLSQKVASHIFIQ